MICDLGAECLSAETVLAPRFPFSVPRRGPPSLRFTEHAVVTLLPVHKPTELGPGPQ